MQNIDDYKHFFDVDLTKLPTDVLKSIDYSVRKELEKRRRSGIESNKIINKNIHETEKILKKKFKFNGQYNYRWLDYLDVLLDDDWSHLFDGDNEKKYYVYFHITPNAQNIKSTSIKLPINTNGMPFYVGKGTGNRAYDLNRNQGHGALLKQLKDSGYSANDIVYIVKDGMTEPEALELESKLIYFFGTKYEETRRGILVNLDIPKRM